MSKHIEYRKFDEMGNLRAEKVGRTQYTVRGAMAVLRASGFRPMVDDGRKLHRCWTNGCGTNAYIL